MTRNANSPATYADAKVDTCFRHDGFRVLLLSGEPSERQQLEKQLIDASIPLPLHHRISWTQAQLVPTASFFLETEGRDGMCSCAFAVEVVASRALPGHVIWRVERFGSAHNNESRTASLRGLAHYATRDPRVLRVHLEVFSRDSAVHASVAQVARDIGFANRAKPRMYADTISIDLRPSEEEIFASFHGTARRHVRAVDKNPVELRLIENPSYSERMTALFRETMRRTGGRAPELDWPVIIKFSQRYPELSRIIGLYQTDADGPPPLIAFAWGRFHGDHADYAAAASARNTNLRLPLGYALAWDLMRWAKQQGAPWFDFGGITSGRHGEADPKGGISDFKRYFGGEVISVGEEWVFEPHPLKAKIANTVSAGATWARKLFISRS